ncbi:MAG: DUF1540 domain-containing protein [Firmicutes bacterium]|nr:DUF1540 domain-containing protein [Bacillota bacterium]
MVQECKYNKNNECLAGGVEVKSQQNAINSGVQTSSHTLCETFAPRDSSSAGADDLTLS